MHKVAEKTAAVQPSEVPESILSALASGWEPDAEFWREAYAQAFRLCQELSGKVYSQHSPYAPDYREWRKIAKQLRSDYGDAGDVKIEFYAWSMGADGSEYCGLFRIWIEALSAHFEAPTFGAVVIAAQAAVDKWHAERIPAEVGTP